MMPYDDTQMPFYALGVNLAMQVGGGQGNNNNLKTLLNDDELDIVLNGFCNQMKKGTTKTTTEEQEENSTSAPAVVDDAKMILQTYGPQLNDILQNRSSMAMNRIQKQGEEYVQNFLKNHPESIQKESGLVYCPTIEGTGLSPTLQSTVEVHYHGTLIDGTVFDSSVDRGQTITFPLGGVIRGWQEGLQLMKEGGKATLVCPSQLAYGDAGSGDVIPPRATLQFEVELLKVTTPP